MERRAPVKKPSGGRPRTFSTDSSRLFAEQSDSQLPAAPDTMQRDKKPSTLRLVKHNVSSSSALTPSPQFHEISLSPGDIGSTTNTQASVIHSPKPVYERPGSPKASSLLPMPPSPSKLRWDSLRRHVLQDPTQSVTSTITPRDSSPKPSLLAPASIRPSTPKASRFPRLGMRQVVDNAREAVVDDLRRFAEDIEKACVETRNPDSGRAPKVEREPSQATVGSYLSLPLNVTGGSSTVQANSMSKQASQQSFSTSRPSVNVLLRTLERYEVSPMNRPRMLPLENQVLSALLMPFLSPGVVDSEKQLALRAFTLITQVWRGESNEVCVTSTAFIPRS